MFGAMFSAKDTLPKEEPPPADPELGGTLAQLLEV